METLELTKRKN